MDIEQFQSLALEKIHLLQCYYGIHSSEVHQTALSWDAARYQQIEQQLAQTAQAHPDWKNWQTLQGEVAPITNQVWHSTPHQVPMLSLSNRYSLDEWGEWCSRIEAQTNAASKPIRWLAELKIDGVALAVRYRDGMLDCALTRGNGESGDVITPNASTIEGLPQQIVEKGALEVRGEVYFPLDAFNRLNEQRAAEGEPLYKNPRNTTAGTLKMLDTAEVARRGLRFAAYDWVGESRFECAQDTLQWIEELGFSLCPHWVCSDNRADIVAFYEQYAPPHDLNFAVDGVVIKVDDLQLRKQLGFTALSPRWATALKFVTQQASTTLNGIEWGVGRTGNITPVALLEPVELLGTTVSRAMLNNYDFITKKDLHLHDQVLIEKGGEIIPKVCKVLVDVRTAAATKITALSHCPSCQALLEEREAKTIHCETKGCTPIKIQKALAVRSAAEWKAAELSGVNPSESRQGESEQSSAKSAGVASSDAELFIEPLQPGQPCPICDLPLRIKYPEQYCINLACLQQQARRIEHFVSRKGMDIESIGPALIAQLLANDLIKSYADLYQLSQDDLEGLEGIKEKTASTVLQGIEDSKTKPLHRFLFALGIPGLGSTNARELAAHFSTLHSLHDASVYQIQSALGIELSVENKLYEFLQPYRTQAVTSAALSTNALVASSEELSTKAELQMELLLNTNTQGTTEHEKTNGSNIAIEHTSTATFLKQISLDFQQATNTSLGAQRISRLSAAFPMTEALLAASNGQLAQTLYKGRGKSTETIEKELYQVLPTQLHQFLHHAEQWQRIEQCMELGVMPQPAAGLLHSGGVVPALDIVAASEHPLAGKSAVITGTLSLPRQEWTERLLAARVIVSASISAKTDYLIAGDNVGQAKRIQAEKWGVPILSEADLEQLLDS